MEKTTIKEIESSFRQDFPQLFETNDVRFWVGWRSAEDIGEELKATLPEYTTEDTEIDPSLYYLGFQSPIIFDHRLIPSTYRGFKVEMIIGDDESATEWDFGDRECIPYKESADPQKYVDFVYRCGDEIRKKLKSDNMTIAEMLDAVCWGNFQKYKSEYENSLKVIEDYEEPVNTFIKAWNSFLDSPNNNEINESISDCLTEDFRGSNRTKTIMGLQEYGKVSPLGNYLESYYFTEAHKRVECRTEYDKIDLVIGKSDNNFQFNREYESQKKRNASIFYPKVFEIIIEHENDFKSCWQEMTKLTYRKARLKVLITYNKPNENGKEHREILEVLRTNFRDIIMQANREFPENEMTQYILIIGQKVYINKYLKWDYFAFDIKGNCKVI